MTDLWDYGDGLISEGYSIGFFYADSTSITAGMGVIPGTSAAGRIAVTVSAGLGDAFGVALKTPVAVGDSIPVLILGVHKFTAGTAGSGTIPTIGKGVINSHVAGTGKVIKPYAAVGTSALATLAGFGVGSSYILGIALQTAVSEGDEILVLVGRW